MRNFRQALASPHSVALFTDSARPLRERTPGGTMRRLLSIVVLVGITSGCALSMSTPNISEIKNRPSRFHDRTVSVNGVVTSSWGVPLVPFRFYKVDDGTGEITVLSQNTRMPGTGEHVRVKGKVEDVAMFGGRALGLHLKEEDLYIKR
jgi:hypothetical protein